MNSKSETSAVRYPAPALARGLEVLGILGRNGPSTLEELAQATRIPKASLLRILNTLMMLGRVARDEAGRSYTALARLVNTRGIVDRHRPQLRQLLRALARETGCTAEWYEPDQEDLALTDRAEPQRVDVFLKARVGFRRSLDGELEAVARVALAAEMPCPGTPDYWQYDERGERRVLPPSEVGALLRAAAGEYLTMDRGWNTNGVRRYAAGVLRQEELIGIMALAETFKPGVDQQIEANLQGLRQAADELQSLINQRS